MKGLIGAIILVVVVFFAVPMLAGGTLNTCQALEQHDVSKTASNVAGSNTGIIHNVINTVGQAGATGDTAQATESQAHPNTPTVVSCTASYWKSFF